MSDELMARISALAIDCDDPWRISRFWQQLIGGELAEDSYGDVELRGGPLRLDFLRVPDPAKRSKNRLHLDLSVPADRRKEAIDRAVAVGATTAEDIYDGGLWQVLRDPDGNELCIVWGSA